MSVVPIPAQPEGSDLDVTAPPRLHLVAEHEHVWQLRSVEYDDSLEVRLFECTHCDDVLYS